MQDRWFLGFIGAILATGVGIALVGVVVFANHSADELPPPNPNLPEWFDPAYRIGKNRSIIFAPKTAGNAQAKRNPEAAPPEKYTEDWLEERFTHYIDVSNAFIWSTPKVAFPAHGKIMAGIKVIVGEQVGDLSLICAVTADGRPENMYVPSNLLRERSQGPPHVEDKD
jgi:hypothetical protein